MSDSASREELVNKVIAEYLAAVEAGRAPDGQGAGRSPRAGPRNLFSSPKTT